MRLSESLRRNVMEVTVGGVLNKFKIKTPRRDALFFADIIGGYIKECEKAGHSKKTKELGQRWGALLMQQLPPAILKKLPPTMFLNIVMRKVWVNLGLMSDLHVTKEGDIIRINTKNESNIRAMGKNHFAVGFYEGILNVLYKSQMESIATTQTREFCEYIFKIKNIPFSIDAKKSVMYYKLNHLQESKGITFKKCLELKIFRLKENQLFFRGKPLILSENTIYHLLSNNDMLLNRIPNISNTFFQQVIENGSTHQEKLVLLKTLLESMGWGIIKIVYDKNKILIEIKNPPYGLQAEKDNWGFLIQTILGYLWLIDNKYKIYRIKQDFRTLRVIYAINKK